MTERQKILKELEKIINGVKDIAHVEVNKVTLPDVEQADFPACFIYAGNQALSGRFVLVGQKVWEWEILVQVYAPDSQIEDLLGKVSNKIAKNPTLNKSAIDCDLETIDINVFDLDRSIVSLVMVFNTIYRHEFGAA